MEFDDIKRALRAEADAVTPEMLRHRNHFEDSSNQRDPARKRRNIMIATAAVVTVAAAATFGVFTLSRNSSSDAPTYAGIGVLHEGAGAQSVAGACGLGTTADDLADVSKVADAVFVGSVVRIEPDAPSDPSTLSLSLSRKLTVRVDQPIDGNLRQGDAAVVIDPGWVRDNTSNTDWYPMIVNGWPRLQTGSIAVFPVQAQADGQYAFLCSGPLLVEGDMIAVGNSDTRVNKQAYGKSLKEVISAISGH